MFGRSDPPNGDGHSDPRRPQRIYDRELVSVKRSWRERKLFKGFLTPKNLVGAHLVRFRAEKRNAE